MPGTYRVSVTVADEDTGEKRETKDLVILKSLSPETRTTVLAGAISGLIDKLEQK